MNTKTILVAGFAAAALSMAASARADDINVTYSDDANGYILAGPGDQFYLNGGSGSVDLFSGVAQNVDVLGVTENLGCCWDNNDYSAPFNSTLTLNGVTGGFTQSWDVFDYDDPSTIVGGAGPQVFNVAGGTITVTLNGGGGNCNGCGGFGAYTATMLYQSGAPEPAMWALMLSGFFGAGAALRRRKLVTA